MAMKTAASVDTSRIVALARARRLAESGAARTIRQGAGLSLREIAIASDVGLATASRWERAQRSPRGEGAIRWAAVIDALAKSV